MKEQQRHTHLKKAFEKSLDVLGERSKKSLLVYLEKDGIKFSEQDSPSIEELESALRLIFGQGAYIITNEFHKNLVRHARPLGMRTVLGRQGKSLA